MEISLSLTGALPGEVVVGREKKHGVKGSSFLIVAGEVKPLESIVLGIQDEQWPQICEFMQKRAYFAKKSFEEIRKWLVEHSSPIDK